MDIVFEWVLVLVILSVTGILPTLILSVSKGCSSTMSWIKEMFKIYVNVKYKGEKED
jgi:hypothetical protein